MPALSARPLRVAFVTSEVYPFSKTGGLADVSSGLPRALKNRGHDIRILSPLYQRTRSLFRQNVSLDFKIPLGDQLESGQIIETFLPQTTIPAALIKHDPFFDRRGIYGQGGENYKDNDQRFIFLCRATLEGLKSLNFKPDILHLNDWQTALIAPMRKGLYANDPFFAETGVVYTIHNLEFQGLFSPKSLSLAQLGQEYFTFDRLEFHGQVSFAKGGLAFADKINTVSPTYRNETLTPELGCGLDGLLRIREKDYEGILNGLDYSIRDPRSDSYLPENYGPENLSGKSGCKEHLQKEFFLPLQPEIPLLGFVGRLTNQKGLDLVAKTLKDLMAHPLQIVFLGTGDPTYHQFLSRMRAAYPNKIGVLLGYSEEVSHQLYAGADMLLMPSRSEPCGLAQMIAMRYGTPPIVMQTGGLADTVIDYADRESGNGFVFSEFATGAFKKAILRALITFTDRPLWKRLQENAMKADFSWDRSAEAYENLYFSALQKVRGQ